MARTTILTPQVINNNDDAPVGEEPAIVTSSALVRGRAARSHLPAPLTIAAGRRHTADTILRAWYEGKSQNTIRSYQHDLEDFTLYFSRALGISPIMKIPEALTRLFQQSSPSAHEVVLGFRHFMCGAHMSPATINRHLGALRSVSKLGRMLGMMTWSIEVSNVKHEPRRSTSGPTVPDIRRMLAATSHDTEAETRDYAIVLMFYAVGLRVSELCGMNLEECNLTRGSAWIKGKGRREKELVPLPAPVTEALARYLRHRGEQTGPLFKTRGARGKRGNDGRLETRSVLRIVRKLGQRIGLHIWCHALRHTSITQAAELGQRSGLGIDKIRAHSRHADLKTLTTYLDDHDRQGTKRALADLVASTVTEPGSSTTTNPDATTTEPTTLRLTLRLTLDDLNSPPRPPRAS